MRTHTTLTDTRRIVKLANEGVSVDDICKITDIVPDIVKHIISVKCPKKAPAKKAAKTVDPLS